jgi:group I intron endonuclease
MHYIYIIKNKINKKIYVGQTVCPKQRWKQHISHMKNNINKSPHLYSSMNKYGLENFVFIIIKECESLEKANNAECFWIECLKTRDKNFGFNVKEGGNNGLHSAETKLKMSINNSGKNNRMYGKHHTDEAKKLLSVHNSGENNFWYGKTLSNEHKYKISLSNSAENNYMFGKSHTEEAKQKISETHKGKPKSECHKNKLSEASKGRAAPNKGIPHTQEAKNKISKSKLKITKELANLIIEGYYASNMNLTKLALKYCLGRSSISRVIKNKIRFNNE